MRLTAFLIENARWLAAGALLAFLSSFGQTFFIAIFAGEIRSEFGLSHGQWGGIYTLGTTASAIAMVWAGGLTDRFRVRVLGAIVLVMLALACLSMATVSQAWLLPFVIFALRFAGQGMTSHISVVAMSRWFVKTRGRALSIATLGFAAGEALLPLVFVALMVQLDWRILWMFAAAIALSGIPFLLLLLTRERTPQSMAMSDQSLGMGDRHWTRHQTLRHFLFWFMVPALMGPAAFVTAFFFQQVHFAEIKGWTHVQLVALFPLYTGMSIAAMLLSGWALDRWGTARLIPFMHLPMVLAFVLFSVASSLPVAMVGLLFMAMTTGANSTIPNAFWAEFYGTRNLGSIKAMAAAVMVLGSALGPGITGVMIDAGVGLETQYLFVAAYFVGTSLLMRIGIARARVFLPVAA
jgi:MFS family permease